jgi:subtilisin family serine protease
LKKIFIIATIFTLSLYGEYFLNYKNVVSLTKLDGTEPFKINRNNNTKRVTYYKDNSGKKIGVDRKIIVAFDNMEIQGYIEREYDLEFIEGLTQDTYLYRVKNGDTLFVANKIALIEGVRFSHPDFIIEKDRRGNDRLYWQSWFLKTIDVERAWRISRGQGVIVGIYDEGIDIEHEDLRANIYAYGNYSEGGDEAITVVKSNRDLNNGANNAPKPASENWHGTACAGLIAAVADNNIGSSGVAPKAKLIAVRYAKNNISKDIKALYDMESKGASIISNSWGTNSIVPAFNEALKNLSINGRGGKGVLLFFATGNDGCNMDGYYKISYDGKVICQEYKSSGFNEINDESESPYVIAISATNRYNDIASYSNYGSAVDFVAPGGSFSNSIVTTDKMGWQGFTNSNYTSSSGSFSGTSAAAPIAAGIAALVLSANPTLSQEEVIDIFKATAKKVGRYRYVNGRNDHAGYGLLDAGAAVNLAKNYGNIEVENFAKKIYDSMH